MDDQRSFPGKLLLFGEYAIIHGSQALAVPLHRFSASWKMKGQAERHLDWLDLIQYVKDQARVHNWEVDFSLWQRELDAGLYLSSSIKAGYGVGSSGSLVAAIYHRYFLKKVSALAELRNDLGCLESYFHGASSGLDPLVSYLDKGIFIKNKTEFKVVNSYFPFENISLVLLDTGIQRETSPLVQRYLDKYKEEAGFCERIESIKKINQTCIQQYMSENELNLFKAVQELSRLQFGCFKEMIPEGIYQIWSRILDSDEHVMKLCGAGGGGYFLLFTKNIESLKTAIEYPIIVL